MSKESGGAPGGGGNHNGGVNGGGANSGSSSNGGGSNSGKGGGKNDSSSKGSSQSSSSGSSKGSSSSSTSSSKSSSSTSSKSSTASKAGTTQAGNQQGGSLTAGKGGLAGGDGSLASSDTTAGKKDSGKPGVASRVSSVNQALSSYGAAPSYARSGYGDTLNSQRQQAEVSKQGSNNSISSIGGPSMYGMGQESFDKSIGTDNFNGVIGNIQQKAQRGTASEADRASLANATSDYNNLRGAGVLGNTLAGTPGQWGAQKLASAAMDDPGDYLSGAARKAATGGLDDGRVIGQRDKIGDGGMADSAVKGGASLLGSIVPGAGLLANGISSSLTVGAPGLGELLNSINERLGNTVNSSANNSNGSGKDYVAPPRQSLTGAQQGEGTLAFDSSYYDPSRFNVTAGKRGY